uniref:Amidohydrolase 3 domain-containing protein n=1 Tax=Amphora coffeiformis TaxID=265554 RepID=A0A7S3P3C9_9STRA|eukprot:scaffold1457_cov185-Amphora_coffeaeformis.AAC.3
MALNDSSSSLARLSAVAACALAVTAAVASSSSSLSKRQERLRRRLAWFARLGIGHYWIQNVKIPIANLSSSSDPKDSVLVVDHEGLVRCHVEVRSGRIAQITMETKAQGLETTAPPSTGWTWVVEGHGCILLPCFVDAHTHLMKTQNVPRAVNKLGTFSEALQVEATEQLNWQKYKDVYRRIEFAIQCALHYGTRAMRTHLDGCESDNTQVRESVYRAFRDLKEKYRDKLVLQGVANLWLPLWLDASLAKAHAHRAAQCQNVVLGAYVGNPLPSDHVQTVAAMDALFTHAKLLDLDVDLHMDESNDPDCCAILCLVESLTKARRVGYQGRVVLGHCCALSLQSPERQAKVCQDLARLQVYVVANPTTNLNLQDRRGSTRPQSLPIPADTPRTPQWRGLTLVQELQAAGVTVAAASDNVRDHWYPYGDYDMLGVWALVLQLGHLDTAPTPGHWANLGTESAAQAMGLCQPTGNLLVQDQTADFVLFPSARRISELLARPQVDRVVVRGGVVTKQSLPDFSLLDDLVGKD